MSEILSLTRKIEDLIKEVSDKAELIKPDLIPEKIVNSGESNSWQFNYEWNIWQHPSFLKLTAIAASTVGATWAFYELKIIATRVSSGVDRSEIYLIQDKLYGNVAGNQHVNIDNPFSISQTHDKSFFLKYTHDGAGEVNHSIAIKLEHFNGQYMSKVT